MKKIIQIVLFVGVIALGYILYNQIMSPVHFQKEATVRKDAVISRIKDIRTAERAYKQVNQKYCDNFDELIEFVLNDSMEFEKKIVSEDDSVAMALLKKSGKKNIEKFTMAVIDTIFGNNKLSADKIKELRYIPFGNGEEFILNAGNLATESKVVVPVFECKAPYKIFMADMDQQQVVNLIDADKTIEKYPGVKVGSMEQATNDAGNWE